MLLDPVVGQGAFVLAVVFAGMMLAEWFLRRLGRGPQLSPVQIRRRAVAAILLELDLVLWILANPLMNGRRPAEKLLYLLFAMLLAVVPLMLAIREGFYVLREYGRTRATLLREPPADSISPPSA